MLQKLKSPIRDYARKFIITTRDGKITSPVCHGGILSASGTRIKITYKAPDCSLWAHELEISGDWYVPWNILAALDIIEHG